MHVAQNARSLSNKQYLKHVATQFHDTDYSTFEFCIITQLVQAYMNFKTELKTHSFYIIKNNKPSFLNQLLTRLRSTFLADARFGINLSNTSMASISNQCHGCLPCSCCCQDCLCLMCYHKRTELV